MNTETPRKSTKLPQKMIGLVALAAFAGLIYWQFGYLLDLNVLAEREARLKSLQAESPWLVYGAAFFVYVVVTGLSLPGAAILTLLMGWYFGFWRALLLVRPSRSC